MGNSNQIPEEQACRHAALSYRDCGWRPIPIQANGKEPLIRWKKYQEQSPTVEEINQWWNKWPDANVAILSGRGSGFVVIDIDSSAGEEAFLEVVGDLSTATSVTANGTHRLFQYPEVPLGNKVRCLEGMDIRGDAGYIVAPPSIHPSGCQYRWDDASGRGLDCPLAAFPSALLELLADPPQPVPSKTSAGCTERSEPHVPFRLPEAIGEGQRNDVLFRYACSLRAHGVQPERILASLTTANLGRCQPPVADDELINIAGSACEYEPEARRNSDDLLLLLVFVLALSICT